MRFSAHFAPTLREAPATASHSAGLALLLRAGFIRQSSPGIYNLLPLGHAVVARITGLVDARMAQVGAQRLALATLLTPTHWHRTGRWGLKELVKLKDRHRNEYCLAPTHEEEITSLVAQTVTTQRQLPVRLYQIGHKYRDELKTRQGLLRSKEFIMKDLYTFDATREDAMRTYDAVRGAYNKLFSDIGLPYYVADADSGSIGGDCSHEYHFASKVGEDVLVNCEKCKYTANTEKANARIALKKKSSASTLQSLPLPDTAKEIPGEYFDAHSVLNEADSSLSLLILPTGRRVNNYKVKDTIAAYEKLERVDIAALEELLTSSSKPKKIVVAVDQTLKEVARDRSRENAPLAAAIKAASENKNMRVCFGDFINAEARDGCPSCAGELREIRSTEVAHTFYLGQKYSAALGAEITRNDQSRSAIEMGCFGIGISRLLAAIVEVSHDAKGIVWPAAVAPYKVNIVPMLAKDAAVNARVTAAAHRVYDELCAALPGQVVLDDRAGVSPGYKMNDSLLIGFPVMLILGKRFQKDGLVEVEARKNREKAFVGVDSIVQHIARHFAEHQ